MTSDFRLQTSNLKVLIAGVSTRAAAESAARAGFAVTAIDAFGDLDQHRLVRAHTLRSGYSPDAAARLASRIECDAVTYLSNFENHPNAVSRLAAGRALWGNAREVIGRVRDPIVVAQALARRGIATPEVRLVGADPCVRPVHGQLWADTQVGPYRACETWLVKPLASGGGHRVRVWRPGTRVPRACYLQELVDGTPGSVVFVAAGGRAVPIGVSRQLIGEESFGASAYRYCGNILTAAGEDDAVADAACALAGAVCEEFGLVGVNGIDFVAKAGVPYPIEVNPRWCASMEIVERAYGLSVFGAHAAACCVGMLPDFDVARARRGANTVGKAVVYARSDVTVGDTRAWLADGVLRDVPPPDSRIRAGRPVCTVFAAGCDAAACHALLVQNAERVYARLNRVGHHRML